MNKLFDDSYLDNTGKALAMIRIIRNDFAHGSYSFPEPDDWSSSKCLKSSSHVKKVNISSRLILLTIQMLLISFFKDERFSVLKWGTSDSYVDIIEELYTVHLIDEEYCNFGLFYHNQ